MSARYAIFGHLTVLAFIATGRCFMLQFKKDPRDSPQGTPEKFKYGSDAAAHPHSWKRSFLARPFLAALCIALAACAGLSPVFEGPPVPYGTVTLNGKAVLVKQLGVDCVCPRVAVTDSWFEGAVLSPRNGCNDGNTICSPNSIYVYEHEVLEVATGLHHSDIPSRVTGCYNIDTAGGEYKMGDQLCWGQFGDYRLPGRGSVAVAVTAVLAAPVLTATVPPALVLTRTMPVALVLTAAAAPVRPAAGGHLALRMSPVCECVTTAVLARRQVLAKAG
jgi:hypothetical protein